MKARNNQLKRKSLGKAKAKKQDNKMKQCRFKDTDREERKKETAEHELRE